MYDYLVIGGGSGGVASARRAASHGMKVGLIESHRLGGTCVNVGCVPKKVMWNTASIAEAIHDAPAYGFENVGKPVLNWGLIKSKRDAYVARLNGIYENNLNREKVEYIKGFASFVDNETVKVGDQLYSGKKILIAVGSEAWIPDIPGAKEFGVTSDGFFELESLPKKVAIVGAGYIAVELAGIFKALGTNVSIIIRQEEFLRSFDSSIREGVMESYRNMGIDIMQSSSITEVVNKSKVSGEKNLSLTVINKDTLTTTTKEGYDCLIWAVGRQAKLQNVNIESAGVKLNSSGFIEADEFQRTVIPSILALGDVCGIQMLTPVAIAAGRKLSERLFNSQPDAKLSYEEVPSVIFSHPVAGSIGYPEHEALKKFGRDNIKVYQSKFVNMYYAMMESDKKQKTHYKIICEGKNERIVGLHLFGMASDEILQGFGVAVKMGATKADFDNCVAIHPTAGEELVTMK